ncbi:MAG: hypothetical protein WDA70_01250 [Lysobacteraceae bacterium]
MKPARFASRILDLLRLRSGPQDLPYSVPLLYRLAILALLVDLVAAWALEVNEASTLRLLVSFALTFALPWLVLRWRGHEARYVQTMLALLGTGIAFSLLFLPLAMSALAHGMVTPEAVPTARQALFAWLILAMVVWKITVTASIWRHALDWSLPAGVGVALLLFVAEFGLDRLLFAGTGGA